MNEIQTKLQDIFREVFDEPALVLNDATTAEDIPGWTSFTHVGLIYAVETDFGVRFGLGESKSLKNVGELMRLISRKLEAK